ncbi:signal peptidase I [Mycolicibacterium smegmatis]|uniref:Signal peptidase I n=1 Tax=Mycolicibacterium smegmatis (strain ATCC 700084 / mc(2)155) TaxID=246196 RepID=A0QV43_MYCS2|nr:signal peptidase I [Mycolicibacterium smegmatis]ABK71873.1 signal peptidase I [Mycolicibacterium smegmatis MC2 155]AIU07624.1 signal peptidase I [Mycolicibacterium smegmatis MC2 155]AIU14249.1 signal peptidase I [Mycolicibacterium smegmatis]AIU20872.1 signal peptidase I [Mycolicibacterium smegmatis]MBE9618600.1 signal peptidase I [Mycolicibacterium smegmatis]
MTGSTDSTDASSEDALDHDSAGDSAANPADEPQSRPDPEQDEKPKRKHGALREGAILVTIAVVLYYVMLTFIARPYLIPSESMEPTLHGCNGCVGDRIMVDKLTYRFTEPRPGDVVVFKGPPSWNIGYKSIRSDNPVIRGVQNALSFIGFVPPDENDLVKRVIAVGGQTVECRAATGLTVDGKKLDEPYLDPTTMMADPAIYPCLGNEFGPVTVPEDRIWVMGDNRTHSADSRVHCTNLPADAQKGLLCTGDPTAGTIPVENVIGKARFIAWPPSRWGGISDVNPQTSS